MTTLPTGETLPDYDDGPADGVDIDALWSWLVARRADRWGPDAPVVIKISEEKSQIRDVLTALQAVGDATLIKNATYRAMRKDGADIEHLAARLANTGRSHLIIECGGPVGAALAILTELDADISTPPPAIIEGPTA